MAAGTQAGQGKWGRQIHSGPPRLQGVGEAAGAELDAVLAASAASAAPAGAAKDVGAGPYRLAHASAAQVRRAGPEDALWRRPRGCGGVRGAACAAQPGRYSATSRAACGRPPRRFLRTSPNPNLIYSLCSLCTL